jgi:predicted PurR-regulated permease PerM
MSLEPNPATRTEALLQTAALVALIAGCVTVLLPFLSALLTALVLVSSTWPLFERVRRGLRGRSTIAAGLMTGALALSVLLPVAWLASEGLAQVPELVQMVRGFVEAQELGPPPWLEGLPWVGVWLSEQWSLLAQDRERMLSVVSAVLDPAQSMLVGAGLVLGQGIVQTAMALLVGFFLFKDGDAILLGLRAGLHRISGELGDELLRIVHTTVQSVVLGIVGTAVAQGAVALFGFWALGVPGAVLLSLATGALSVIPAGPPIVWIGSTIWLFGQDRPGSAVAMAIYGLTVISSIDNVVKPILISRGGSLPFALVLFGVFGGVLAFGFTGVFLGPSFLAVGLALYTHWTQIPAASREAL